MESVVPSNMQIHSFRPFI